MFSLVFLFGCLLVVLGVVLLFAGWFGFAIWFGVVLFGFRDCCLFVCVGLGLLVFCCFVVWFSLFVILALGLFWLFRVFGLLF